MSLTGGERIASQQLTGRGLGGSRSSSSIGLGSLGGSGRGRGGSRSGGGRGLLGLLVLGGLLDGLVAALLEGSLELALQVVEGAERCGEDESVSWSLSFLAVRCAATHGGGPLPFVVAAEAVTASGDCATLAALEWTRRVRSLEQSPHQRTRALEG
jgi:hypothetical protein